jgi:metal-dependent HD superfamily phosphatase/phosphodiesterase
MPADGNVSLLDLFDLPDPQREILLYLARNGPADGTTLAQATGLDPAEVNQALEVLVEKGRVQRLTNGQVDAIVGRVKGRTTLPAQLWNALLTTDRLYSQQEIATLRTAIPILQLARTRMIEFADHGPGHALRVKSFATQLGYLVGLDESEQGLLRAAALFHDVGNIVDRRNHNVISQETVLRLAANGELPFQAAEAEVVGLVSRWHRAEYEPQRRDEVNGTTIRTGLLASILRVADAMDIDHRRSDYTERFSKVLRFFYADHLPYWTSLEEILGVRIHCTPAVRLQVFTQGRVRSNRQIAMLRGDLGSTPFEWSLQQVAVQQRPAEDSSRRKWPGGKGRRSTLLVFPFEPHSVVMAALSRKHLTAAGCGVELLCYPDTAGSPGWLWGHVLPEAGSERYSRLVVIGDRPDSSVTPQLLETVRCWQAAGVMVSVLNRHEANWTRLPTLLQQGVEVILGGDWAYFWGKPANQADLIWGRIAALCTRDPTQSTVGLTAEEQAITRGLLKSVYDAARQPASDTDGWAALANPILDRIQADDRTYFANQAGDFVAAYATMTQPGQVEGRVLRLEGAPSQSPQAFYWALEAALERQGRMPERGICYHVPYAIATWSDNDVMELLAINHWREEQAIPIRLLYPADLGPSPVGNESTIRVRLPALQAARVVQALLHACNQPDLP